MQGKIKLPPGYRQDARGNLIPEANIKEIDKLRDEVISKIIKAGLTVADEMAIFKTDALAEIQAFCDLSKMEYNAPLGGTKGNVTLISFDGRYKILRAIAEHIQFDERLEAAKALIDECLTEWTKESSDNLKAIVNKAFEVNKDGNISTARVLGLRSIEITDPRWLNAMKAIADSVTVVGSRTYLRLYERVGEADEYQPISLNS